MSKKKYEKYDELGRLTLPEKAVQRFGLYQNDKLLMTVDEQGKRIVMCSTDEEPPESESGREMRERQHEMRQKPTNEWRYIRRMDGKRRVVLPRTMRELLHWSEDTTLQIVWDDATISIEEAKLSKNPVIRFFQKIF